MSKLTKQKERKIKAVKIRVEEDFLLTLQNKGMLNWTSLQNLAKARDKYSAENINCKI